SSPHHLLSFPPRRSSDLSLGHHLDPVVQVGKDGVTEGLLAALDVALETHELVKVRLGEAAGSDRGALAEAVAEGAQGQLVGVLGDRKSTRLNSSHGSISC